MINWPASLTQSLPGVSTQIPGSRGAQGCVSYYQLNWVMPKSYPGGTGFEGMRDLLGLGSEQEGQ